MDTLNSGDMLNIYKYIDYSKLCQYAVLKIKIFKLKQIKI